MKWRNWSKKLYGGNLVNCNSTRLPEWYLQQNDSKSDLDNTGIYYLSCGYSLPCWRIHAIKFSQHINLSEIVLGTCLQRSPKANPLREEIPMHLKQGSKREERRRERKNMLLVVGTSLPARPKGSTNFCMDQKHSVVLQHPRAAHFFAWTKSIWIKGK